MPLEKQVCSLELARKLRELGVKQDSLFNWQHKWEGSSDDDAGKDILIYGRDGYHCIQVASAFTVAELGETFPAYKKPFKTVRTYWNGKNVGAEIGLKEEYVDQHAKTHYASTEADARAKLLIYLLKNNLITL